MSLLNYHFAHPLDPGYAEAAEERAALGEAEPSGRRHPSPAIFFGMMALGLLLAMALIQVRDTESIVTAERESVVDLIRTEQERTDILQNTVVALDTEVANLEDLRLESSDSGRKIREDLQRVQAVAGPMAVTGPGVVVTITDGPEDIAGDGLAKVLDLDLQQVINGLWHAGAEAISINGQRLTTLTAIRMANQVNLVNYQPIASPYEISAIGDARTLGSRFSEGPGGQWLRAVNVEAGIESSVSSEESLTLPGVSTQLSHARPLEDS